MRRFGIDADDMLMHDFDHAVLFADVDVAKVLGLTSVEEVTTPKRRRSEVRYSDKQGLERFRTFAEQLYEKRGIAIGKLPREQRSAEHSADRCAIGHRR